MKCAASAVLAVGLLVPLPVLALDSEPDPSGRSVPDARDATTRTKDHTDSESRYGVDLSGSELSTMIANQEAAGRGLVDIEVHWDDDPLPRYSAVFHPIPAGASIHYVIAVDSTAWSDFLDDMAPKDGRFLDVEVDYYSASNLKRRSAIFYEDGDNYGYAVYTTNSDSTFQDRLESQLRTGRAIIDFEAYTEPDDDLRLAGVWVSDPNQPPTVLYYHLESADVSDLIRPLSGRLIDFERYWSPPHGEYRYAVITTMVNGGGWGHYRWQTEADLADRHHDIADSNTHIVDVEMWENASGNLRYGALWGDAVKSLYEVAAIQGNVDAESLPSSTDTLLADFESSSQGTIGLYAKNVRTNQSFEYRDDMPFYLASSAKTAIHVRLWQEVQAGRVDLTTLVPYTNCADCRDDWYIDNRPTPGFDPPDFGNSFAIDRWDRAMMSVSDNAAASMLVDHPDWGVSHDAFDLNEWLASLDGVGRGWWPVTSIHDVDRTIMWQGQQTSGNYDETSYFTIPGWAFEPLWRNGSDTWGDLSDYLGNPPSLPGYSGSVGHERYYAMGLNSATPRAFVLFLEDFIEERFLDGPTTQDALGNMNAGTSLDNNLPGALNSIIEVYAKGGRKGGASDPVSDTAIFRLGPDAVVMGIFTQDNVRSSTTIRSSYSAPIAADLLAGLTPDLASHPDGDDFGPTELWAGQDFFVRTAVVNYGGGDCAAGFDVSFYASTNTTITDGDYLIGTDSVPALDSGQAAFSGFSGDLPGSIPPGTYTVGWLIDDAGDPTWGENGEFDEVNNTDYITGTQLTVLPTPMFWDDFEDGDLGAWSGSVP